MKKSLLLSALLLAGVVSASDYKYEFTPVVGYDIAEGNIHLDDYAVFGGEFQYNGFDAALKPELSVLYSKADYNDAYSKDTDVWRFALNGVYEFDKMGMVVPLAKIGAGYENMSDNYSDNHNSAFVDAGVGAKIPFSDAIALKLEAIYMNKVNDGRHDSNLLILAGLNIAFGKVQKEEPKPAVVAAPVVVEKDSDGDGVVDSLDKCPQTPAGFKVDANGCELDSDGDGVVDSKDLCMETPKGVEVGSNGCALDSDGDGVIDANDKCPNTIKGAKVDVNGCIKPVNLHINFKTGSYEVDEASKSNIKKFADFLNKVPSFKATIVGYTDNVGRASFNQKLSEKRAKKVRQLIINEGVDANRIKAVGKGEADPIASNDTAEGRAKNRRIEAIIEQ